MNSDHDEVQGALGSYVLGALESADRARVDAHLAACGECRDALAELAVLPGLLGRLSPDEVAAGVGGGQAAALGEMTAQVAHTRRAQVRRLRAWQGLAAALAIIALLLAAPVPLRDGVPEIRLGPQSVASDAAPTEGNVTLRERAWGVEVELTLRNLPPRPGYTLLAVADDGHETVAASWSATDTGGVSLTGSCYLPLERLARMEVVSSEAEVLLQFPR